MKKILAAIILAGALLTMVLSGCGTPAKAYTDAGKTISTSINGEFTIALGSNMTTGYSWQPVYDNSSISLQNKEYKESDTTGKQIVGAGGTQYFYFKALKSGEYKITFTYYRPWETPTPQDQVQDFTINVK